MSLSQFEGAGLFVRGLDGMPLIELKTDRFPFTPLAPAQPGYAEVRDAYVGNG